MSIDATNEYEQAIERYAAAVREQYNTHREMEAAVAAAKEAVDERQRCWGDVKAFINAGKIKPGVYRINKGPGMYAEAILIQEHHDYPELFPMFR
jgi:hypothetical protein